MADILAILNENYSICFDYLDLLRDIGSTSYVAFSGENKYFLRIINPTLRDTAIIGTDIQMFLQNQEFAVPQILTSKHNTPYVKTEDTLIILYEFIEGVDSNPEQDAEDIGELVGRLHCLMKAYTGELVKRDKQFYIGRYIDILREKQYAKVDEYVEYGNALWNKIKDLPQGYCHGDMYDGNIRKGIDGKLYIHDFDTSCHGITMYDPTLICDMTKYFEFNEQNYNRSNEILVRFLPAYKKHHALIEAEIDAFPALIAVQHFSTQATIMGIFGLDCIGEPDMDNQLQWLYRWREQLDKSSRF